MTQIRRLTIVLAVSVGPATASPLEDLLQGYRDNAGVLDPARGAAAWTRPVPAPDGKHRRCSDCHGKALAQAGRPLATGKPIPPLAPSVNPDALGDPAKVEKWIYRNCRWTWGRECSPQEKGDLILFLSNQ